MNALLDESDLTEISEADCIDNDKRDKRKLGMSSYIKADSFKKIASIVGILYRFRKNLFPCFWSVHQMFMRFIKIIIALGPGTLAPEMDDQRQAATRGTRLLMLEAICASY